MNTRVTIKRIFLFYITLSTAQLPAADLSVISLALSLVNLAQRCNGYLPTLKQYIPKVKKYIPLHTLNGHKKPIITGIVAIVLASIWLISKKNKSLGDRRDLEKQLELERINFIKKLVDKIIAFFSKTLLRIFWDAKNESLDNLWTSNNKKIQRNRLKKMHIALEGNDFDGLKLLVKTPSWFDRFFISHSGKLIDPNIRLACGKGKTIDEQITNGYEDENDEDKDPLSPKYWITPLQYIIQYDDPDLSPSEKLNLINILLSNGARAVGRDHEENDALHYALRLAKPDIKIIKRLIEDVRPDRPNADRTSCMHLLSDIKNKKTRKEVANVLVGRNPKMGIRNKDRDKPLLYTIRVGRPELVELFLTKAKASIDQVDKVGNSILVLSILLAEKNTPNNTRWTDIIDYLFKNPDVSKITDSPNKNGWRPIHLAIAYNKYIEQLIDRKVNIIRETRLVIDGEWRKISPIQFACCKEFKNSDALFTFLKKNAIPTDFKTSDGDTLAHLIVKNFEGSETIKLMRKIKDKKIKDKRFSLNEKDSDKKTPLEIAFQKGNLKLVMFLLREVKIDGDIVFSDNETLIDKIAQLKDPQAEELMECLIKSAGDEHMEYLLKRVGDDTFKLALASGSPAAHCLIPYMQEDIVFARNVTPAHIVAKLKDETAKKLMAKLAEYDFSLDEQDERHQRPAEVACAKKNIAVLEVLIKQHPDKMPRNTRYAGNNSLAHLIMQFEDEDASQLLSLLKKNHFPLNAQNDREETLFHEAILQNKARTIGWLNKNYPELRAKADQDGQLPLHYAAEQGNRKLYEQLNRAEEQDKADAFGKTPRQLLEENELTVSSILKKPINFFRGVSSALNALPFQ